ncbi:MAG: barstar family protein [Chitinophagaceae bacterium]
MESYLEGASMKTIKDFHGLLKNALRFPDYYGENLDAL